MKGETYTDHNHPKEWRADPCPREGNNEDLPPAREENPLREDGPDQNNGGMEREERVGRMECRSSTLAT